MNLYIYNQVLAHFVTTVDVFYLVFISLAQYLISA